MNIDIMDKVINEDYWTLKDSSFHYSGHMYRGSPYETSNSCGNCDGARCEVCRKIVTPAHLGFSVSTDILHQWLLEKNIPEDIASGLAYGDSYSYKGYYLVWPTEDRLKQKNNDFYNYVTTKDEEVMKVIASFKGKFKVYADLRDAVLVHYGFTKYTYKGHVYNQLERYWLDCNHDHNTACK